MKASEEIGICAYSALVEGGKRTTVEMPRWSDGLVRYEAEPARGEIAGWAQMLRPRTLTLVPVDAAGNEYPEATMAFTLDERNGGAGA